MVDNPGPYSVGTTTVTWTVTDDNGNTATCSQDVVVTDDEDPTITCPSTANISMDAGLCTSSASIGTPTTDDNCGVASVVVDNPGPYSVGTTTVTWTVTDDNGNTATCSQDVVVTDDEDPTIIGCPTDIDITPASSDCNPEVTWNIPQADDNCSATLSSTHNSGDSFPVGTTTVTYTATDASGNTFSCSFDVTITPSDLVLSIDPSTVICAANISCNGATDGTATANVSGGCLPYTYVWSNGQTTQTATGLGAGTYTVTVTDANGSTESESITLTEPETLEIDSYEVSEYIGGAGVSCNGASDGEIDIFIEGGATCEPYDIAWTGPNGFTSSSQNLTGLEAGSYTVMITDINGCTTSATYTISEPAALDPTCTSEDALCNGDANGSVEVSVTGGTAPYSYSWSNGSTDASQSGLTAGTYAVTITDANGCTVSCNSVVDEPEVLTAVVTAFDETLVNGCNGSAIAAPTGGTEPYTYEWSDGQTDATATDLCAGTYSVTVTDANGCEFTTSVVINPPTCDLEVDVTGTDVSCNGGSDGTATATPITQQNNTPFTYLWNNGATTQTLSGVTAGPYTVVITDSIGCEASGSVVISEPTELSVTTTVVDEQTFGGCDGSATATASGGTPPYSYDWSDGQTTATASNLCPGTYTVTVTDANGCEETITITVNELLCTGFSVAVNTDGLSCFEAGDGSATAVVTGGTAPFTYAWSNGETTSSISGLDAGTYTVTVTDAVNCSQTVSGNVSQPALLEAATAVDNVSCHGLGNGVVELTVTGGTPDYSFAWDNGATTEDLNGVGPGTYNVLVTDENGCTTTASAVVTELDTLGASSIDVQVTCFEGNNGSIDLEPTGGLPPYLYDWSNGETTQDISGLSAGTYSVTFADQNGCLFTYETTISEPNLLVATCSAEDALCNGDANGSVSVSVTGGTEPYSYSWSNGSTDASQSGLVAGTYVVTVTDANGCTATCNATVGEPNILTAVVDVQDETLVNGCNGSATANPTGGTPPYSYDWSNGGTTQTITDLCAGTYTVTITDANGCEYTTSNIVNPPSCDLDVDMSSTDVDCNGGETGTATATPITVQNNTPFTYLWNNGATTQTLSGVTAGPYSVVVTDSIGCEASGSVVISEPTALSVTTSVTDEQTFEGCDGSATATASGGTPPYSYEWSDGQTTSTASNLCPGTYTVTVTDANGCEETVTITVNPLLCTGFSVAINTESLSCFEAGDGSATAVVTGGTAPFTYSWSNGGTTATISSLDAGEYIVTVTDAVNCEQTVSVNVSQPALLEAATAVDNVSCHGIGNGVVELTVTGGTPDYTFAWDNGATTEDLNGVGPGSYNVLVTDQNGCTVTASAEVTEPDTLQVSSVDIDPTCFEGSDGSIDLTITGGLGPYLVAWDSGQNTADISGLTAGTYVATIVDQNGCVFVYSTTLSEPDPLTADCSSTDVDCNGAQNGSASVTVSGGTEPYSYSWDTGSTDSNISNLPAGSYTVTVTDANGCTATCTAVVAEPSTLDATGQVTHVMCNGGHDGEINITVTGGTEPYSYSWDNGSTDEDLTGLTIGTYVLTITDANGCTFVYSATITQPDPVSLDITANGPTTFCDGGSVTLSATEGLDYVWAPNGETTQSIVVTQSGSFSVTMTDEAGCVFTSDTVDVTVNPLPQVDITPDGPTAFCDGGSVTLTATESATYSWVPNGETTQSITVTESGSYGVLITDENGCENESQFVSVTIYENPTPQITANGPTEFCQGGSVVLSGSGDFDYVWSPNGEITQSITVTESGDYQLTVTDGNGCMGTSNIITVTEFDIDTATVTADGPTEFCDGGSVVLTASEGDSYFWAPFGQTTQAITVTESGIYRVTVTDENGCQSTSDPIQVVVNDNPAPVITAGGPTEFCEGGSVSLNGPAGFIYNWSPNGEATQGILVTQSGDYQLTVTDENGCTGESNIITVTEFDMDTATITAQGPTEFCDGGEVVLTASGGVSYNWSPNGEITQSISVTASGIYNVTVTDENGCTSTSDDVVVTVNPLPDATVTLSGPTEFCEGDSVTLNAPAGLIYQWLPNGETSQSITVYGSGTFSVIVTDENQCSNESVPVTTTMFEQDDVEVVANGPTEFCNGGSVVLTASSGSSFVWYPNGETTPSITVTQSGIYSVSITDANGCSYASGDSVEVIVNPLPVPTITPNGPTEFCDGGSVELTSSVAESYFWAPNGETSQSITVTESGVYRVTVTDENGCQGTSAPVNVTVYDLPEPTITANGPLTICPEDSVTLTSSSASSYEWSPNGETTQTITVSEPGIYSVMVVDANGCEGESETVEVEDFEVEPVTVMADGITEFCDGDSVTLSASSGDAFVWSPNGETTASIVVTESGDYSVFVTDANGCSTEADTVTVTVYDLPEPVITLSGSSSFCEGDSVTLTVTAGEVYLWEPNGETTQSITVYESGSYYAEIADANTCVGMSDTIDVVVFEIEEIEVIASGDTAFCNGGEVVLSASGGQTFEWMPNGEQSQSITVTESGEYSVEVLDANGCESFSDTVVIVVFELPQVSLSMDALEMCEGDSTLLTASTDDDVTFEWFENGNSISGAADSTLFVSDSSYYSVLITDVNGCTATDDVPTIAVGAVPVAVVTGNTIACPGETLTLTATGGQNYLWSNGETTSSITVLSDSIGTYTVTVSNEFCGQTSSDSAIVEVYDAPDALIQTLSNGFLEVDHLFDEVSGDSSIVYWTWDFGDGQFGEGQSTDHTYSTEEFFTIVVTTENENGCLGFDTVEVEITQVIDIPNVFTPNDDGVNDLFFIDNFGVEAYELTVYNRWGIVMHHDDSGEIAWDGRTPAGLKAKSGTYYYELKVKNNFSEGSFTQTGYITLIR